MIARPSPSPDRPLEGRTVVVTRPRSRSGSFESLLHARGARVLPFPTIRIRPLENPALLREAARGAADYDWLVFTSVHGVQAFGAALAAVGRQPGTLRDVRIAAIGPATAEAVREALSLEVEVVPGEYRAESLAAAILEAEPAPSGRRVLLPRAAEAREVLPRLLEAAGARVDEVPAYHTTFVDPTEAEDLRGRLGTGEIDWLTFTASSTVRGFVSAVGAEAGRARVAAIGPITAGTARELGLPVHVVAREFTIPGLVEAMVDAETGSRPGGEHG